MRRSVDANVFKPPSLQDDFAAEVAALSVAVSRHSVEERIMRIRALLEIERSVGTSGLLALVARLAPEGDRPRRTPSPRARH